MKLVKKDRILVIIGSALLMVMGACSTVRAMYGIPEPQE
jgi:uncharacterized membrane protein YkvI